MTVRTRLTSEWTVIAMTAATRTRAVYDVSRVKLLENEVRQLQLRLEEMYETQ